MKSITKFIIISSLISLLTASCTELALKTEIRPGKIEYIVVSDTVDSIEITPTLKIYNISKGESYETKSVWIIDSRSKQELSLLASYNNINKQAFFASFTLIRRDSEDSLLSDRTYIFNGGDDFRYANPINKDEDSGFPRNVAVECFEYTPNRDFKAYEQTAIANINKTMYKPFPFDTPLAQSHHLKYYFNGDVRDEQWSLAIDDGEDIWIYKISYSEYAPYEK